MIWHDMKHFRAIRAGFQCILLQGVKVKRHGNTVSGHVRTLRILCFVMHSQILCYIQGDPYPKNNKSIPWTGLPPV